MHECRPGQIVFRGYGSAILYCIEDKEGLWAGNDEYETKVNFCPFCGYSPDKEEL